MNTTRETTNKIIQAIQDGTLDTEMVLLSCLHFMSEKDVKMMAKMEMLFDEMILFNH